MVLSGTSNSRYEAPKPQKPATASKRIAKNNRIVIDLNVKNPLVVLFEGTLYE